MDLEIKLDEMFPPIKVGDEVVNLRKPTVGDISTYTKSIKKRGDEEQLDVFREFIVELGMPDDYVPRISVDGMTKLSEFIMGQIQEKK